MCNDRMTTRISRRDFLAAAGISSVEALQASRTGDVRGTPLFRFAAAFPPLAEHLFPSDRWLQAVAGAGYTHCILMVDPFSHPEDIRVVDHLLSIFDMTSGPVHNGYLSWLRAVSRASARHGLRLALEVWEPTLSCEARRTLPSAWKGPALESGYEPLCVSQPEARAWFLKGFEALLEAAPEMDALVMGVNDNDANLCGSSCPRCGTRPMSVRLGELYRDIQTTCQRLRPGFQVIMYDWFWAEDYFQAVFSRVAKGTPILTRMERGASYAPDPTHPEWSGHVFDESLGCDVLGPDFARAQQIAYRYGGPVYVMPTLSGMFEGWELPYVPAAGQMAKKFDCMRRENVAGWVDYDCGGIHQGLMLDLVRVVQANPRASSEKWLQLLARERYGSATAGIAREAWEAFDRGVRVFPSVLDFSAIPEYSGRFGVAIGLTPMHPFVAERARQSRDLGQTHLWFDPHNFLTPEAMPAVRHCLGKALEFARKGRADFDRLVDAAPPSLRASAEFDSRMAELTVLAWQSALNFYEWAAALQGDKSVPMVAVLRDEIAVTRRYRELQASPELELGNMVHTWQLEVAESVPELIGNLFDWNRPEVTGDFFDFKIKDLERQLNDWPSHL